jgi:Icc-related predicted phosphoesterase
MIIDCISDLHGAQPELEGGDLLLIAGDLTATDRLSEYHKLMKWFQGLSYKKIIIVAGNHDNILEDVDFLFSDFEFITYLQDNGTEFDGLKIWGSPWTKSFKGIDKRCMAFTTDKEYYLEKIFENIPLDTDILITHSPPYAILDECEDFFDPNKSEHVGSPALRERVERVQPKLHVFGHIHECGGKQVLLKGQMGDKNTMCVNAAIMNVRYEPVNKPVRIIL